MADYIRREAAERAAHMAFVRRNDAVQYSEMIHQLAKIPAADVVEVVHGEWEPVTVRAWADKPITNYKCSLCGRRLIGYKDPQSAPYCHCGAKMDGGADNG